MSPVRVGDGVVIALSLGVRAFSKLLFLLGYVTIFRDVFLGEHYDLL